MKKKCLRCGYEEFQACIDAHHVIYGDKEELIYLCSTCHMAIHRRQITYEDGIFRPYKNGDKPPSKEKIRCSCGRILLKSRPCCCGRDKRFPIKIVFNKKKQSFSDKIKESVDAFMKKQRELKRAI